MLCMASGTPSKPVSWRPTVHRAPLDVEYTFRRVNSLGIKYTLHSRAPQGDQAYRNPKERWLIPQTLRVFLPRGWKSGSE
jgi:hypothetical protein